MIKKTNSRYKCRKNLKAIICYILLLIVVLLRIVICVHKYNYKYKSFKSMNVIVKVICIEKVEEERVRYKVKYNNDTFLLFLKDIENLYSYGDNIKIKASLYEIESKGNPYEFNYKRYLNSNGYVSVLYANKVEAKNTKIDLLSLVYNYRSKIDDIIDNNLNVKESNFLKSILYGNDIYLDENIKRMFSDIGLGHILCVSGAHVSFLIYSFENITKYKNSKVLKIVLLILFYIFSLFNVSLLRAIIMNILAMFKKYSNVYKRYAIALYIVLVINPYYIFNIGVIFSFLSILGIIIFYSRINSFLKTKFKSKLFSSVINSISTTLSSQIFIIPFEIATFGSISLMCIVSNLLLSVVIMVLLNLGFLLLFFILIPIISFHLFNSISLVIQIILVITKFLNSINYLNIYMPRFNIWMYIVYYLYIVLVIFGDKIWIYFWSKRKSVKKWIRLLKIICPLYILLSSIYVQYFESYVIFFNVGQGNMALIHNNTKNVIIDMGSTEKNVAYNIMKSFLIAKNIHNIDLICITHMHTDHMNGVESLIQDKEINVLRVGYSIPCNTVKEYEDLLETIQENRIAKVLLKEKDKIQIGKINIEILSPPDNGYIQDEDMLNANSNVYYIQKGKEKYLFMGDATKKTEKYVLENNEEILRNVDVYQVSHHGSNTSSYEPLISKLQNAICIISSKKKVYGHPSISTLDILDKYKLKYKITEIEGAIIF